MQVKKVKISLLKGASYNPKDRTEEGARGLSTLAKSIEAVGLVYPIAVTKDNVIIDGHRRVQAVQMLGWEEMPVLVVETEDADKVYAEVNANAYALSGYQTLRVWLHTPKAVTEYLSNRFKKYEELVGRDLLERIAKAGMSIKVAQTAQKIGRYVDNQEPGFIKRTIRWIIKYRGISVTQAYIRLQQPPAALYKAIEAGRELKPVFRSSSK